MKLLLLLLMTFLLSHKTRTDEIFSGKESRPHSRPYMAFLDIKRCNGTINCGGFLIRSDFVMTAARCEGDFITVILGAHNVKKREKTWQTINVKHQFLHPEYNAKKFLNDIMLLKLEKKANLTTAVNTLPLGSRFDSVSPGQQCLVAGWGSGELMTRASDTLQEVELTLRDPSDCKMSFGCFDERSQLCVQNPKSNKSVYEGDFGGPLVCSGVAQGIVSYRKRDAKPPSGITRIAHYSSWINKILKAN